MLRQEDKSWKVGVPESWYLQEIFSRKVFDKVHLFNHLAVEFVHETCENVKST